MTPSDLRIDDLLKFMVKQDASDLHLKPMRPPLIRINGKLVPLKSEPLSTEIIPEILKDILTSRQHRLLEEELAVDFGYSLPGISRFRGSAFVQRGTQSAVFRRVPFDFKSLEDWGMPSVIFDFANLPQGLVLITGPTGSGKSSTLASMIQLVAQTRMIHIVTIEDPIEFLIGDGKGSVTQREVGNDTPSFQTALRNVLRQDPDVIMVGEMRDAATVQTVLTAAETGHLVFSTLHTNSASQTIHRIVDSFPEGNHDQIRAQLSNVLEAVVSLKLVERADGKGLIAAVEILRKTPRISKLIQSGTLDALEEEIEHSVTYHKMQSMNQSLAALTLHGVISHEKALATSNNPGDLDLIIRKFTHAEEPKPGQNGDEMAEPMSDFSKIVELQEIKKAYQEIEERHAMELNERDVEIARLLDEVGQMDSASPSNEESVSELSELRQENDRLGKQARLIRQEYDAKIERLNSRIRELTTGATPQPQSETERKGFFRR
jgi:twitching motility protein PilT